MLVEKLKQNLGTLCMLAIGVFFAANSLTSIDLGSFRRLGPGAFPLLMSLALIIFSTLVLVKEFTKDVKWVAPNFRAVVFVSMGLSAFALFTPLLGVLPGTMLSVLTTSGANERVSFRVKIILSLAVTLGVWLIFVVALRMPFTLIRGL